MHDTIVNIIYVGITYCLLTIKYTQETSLRYDRKE